MEEPSERSEFFGSFILLVSCSGAGVKQRLNDEFPQAVSSENAAVRTRIASVEHSPAVHVEESELMLLGHEASLDVAHLHVVQRQHVLLLFFL